jgi:hypothetical protein
MKTHFLSGMYFEALQTVQGAIKIFPEDIKSNVTAELQRIPKEDFRQCCQKSRIDGASVYVCARAQAPTWKVII